MLRSMNSAISGMQSFQTMLDVIGNNIANVNTIGFKAGRADFADVLSQTISGASAPSATGLGGMNAQQVGLGVKVGAIQTMFTQGADQTTGNPTDLAIQGSGLFVVSPNNDTPASGSSAPTTSNAPLYYTRAGNFSVDASGNLVLPNGMVAVGVAGGTWPSGTTPVLQSVNLKQFFTQAQAASGSSIPASPVTISSSPNVQIGNDGSINVTASDGNQYTIGHLALATVSNPSGLEKIGDNVYQTSGNSGAPTFEQPGANNSGTLMSGTLEMSNVDLTNEMANMLVAENGYAANSHVIGADNTILTALMNMKNS